jgi:hypothetical protein
LIVAAYPPLATGVFVTVGVSVGVAVLVDVAVEVLVDVVVAVATGDGVLVSVGVPVAPPVGVLVAVGAAIAAVKCACTWLAVSACPYTATSSKFPRSCAPPTTMFAMGTPKRATSALLLTRAPFKYSDAVVPSYVPTT